VQEWVTFVTSLYPLFHLADSLMSNDVTDEGRGTVQAVWNWLQSAGAKDNSGSGAMAYQVVKVSLRKARIPVLKLLPIHTPLPRL
jgi:hypothetical protein